MILKEINDSIFENENGEIYYSYGRKLLDEEIPADKEILLLLDPLFLTLFENNIKRLLSNNIKKINICFIPYKDTKFETIEKYFNDLSQLLPLVIKNNCQLNFLSPEELDITFLDNSFYHLYNYVFTKVINSFENECTQVITEN